MALVVILMGEIAILRSFLVFVFIILGFGNSHVSLITVVSLFVPTLGAKLLGLLPLSAVLLSLTANLQLQNLQILSSVD